MSVKFDMSGLEKGLKMFEDKANAAFRMYADTSAKKLESSMKENRPWTDRTGAARNRLRGTASTVKNGYEIKLAHGVDYGIWLELANEKRYAIIEPTIRLESPQVIKGFEKLLERFGD
jgi:hypothetical protein